MEKRLLTQRKVLLWGGLFVFWVFVCLFGFWFGFFGFSFNNIETLYHRIVCAGEFLQSTVYRRSRREMLVLTRKVGFYIYWLVGFYIF